MADKARGMWSMVLVPAILSLLVSVLRLVGELQGWHQLLFGGVDSEGEVTQGLIGISVLIPIFGFWFGFRIKRATGQPANFGKAALLYAIAIVVMIGGMFACVAAGLIVLPATAAPEPPSGFDYMLGLLAVSLVITLFASPRLSLMLVLYALLARIPVVVITYIALQNGWRTHYSTLPPQVTLPEGVTPFLFLATPQLTIWIVATTMVGGLFGCLGARLGK